MSTTLPEEDFEDGYVLEFRRLLHGKCLWLEYNRDRGAVDLGIRLKVPDTDHVGQTRIWFQFKGLHAQTHDAEQFESKGAYADVKITQLREWFEAPEVVYLAVRVESVGKFVAADVRDLVENAWGVDVRWGEVGKPGQSSIRIWIPSSSLIDDQFIASLGRHASMRIDTATYRGQYLGHRLDPLRSELEVLDPSMFDAVVDAILSAHEFIVDDELDPGLVLTSPAGAGLAHSRLLRGRLFATLRWPFPMSVEYGYQDPREPREEGQWFAAQGHVAVLVMSDPGDLRTLADLDDNALDIVVKGAVDQTVVFINDTEFRAGPWRTQGLRMRSTPIGLGALSNLILVTPALYRQFAGDLSWRRPVNRFA